MKNFEKYEHQISKVVNEDNTLTCSIAFVSGIKKQKMCSLDDDCNECSKECLKWMHSEYKEDILSDDEKEIIKSMVNIIHKFGCEVNYVYKYKCANGDCFIQTTFKNIVTGKPEIMDLPYINNDMFKGMKTNKEYKLEELGITCQTQKDS